MRNYDIRYGEDRYSVAMAAEDTRAAFIRKTYGHVTGAILGFVAIQGAVFQSGMADTLAGAFFSLPYAGLLLMVAFIGGGFVAQTMARSSTSDVARYAGLALFTALEAMICFPLIWIAETRFPGEHLAAQAGIVAIAAFVGLTLAVFVSGKNFSFLGPILGVLSRSSRSG